MEGIGDWRDILAEKPPLVPHRLTEWGRAEAVVARLDSAVAEPERRDRYLSVSIRLEALRSAALESAGGDAEDLALGLEDRLAVEDRDISLALDLHRGLGMVTRPGFSCDPDARTLVHLCRRAVPEARSGEAAEALGEDAARDLLADWAKIAAPGLVGASVAFQAAHRRFGRYGPRLARLLAPLLAMRFAGCRYPVLMLSDVLARRGPSYNAAIGRDEARWCGYFLEIAARAAEEGLQRIATLDRLAERWRQSCAPARSSSRLDEALAAIFRRPMFSAASLQRELGLSNRGTALMIDRLLQGRVVEEITGRDSFRMYLARELVVFAA